LTKGKIETSSGDAIEIDFSDMEKRIETKMKTYIKEAKDYKPKDKGGKGVIETYSGSNKTKLLEQLQNVSQGKITEQWTIAIPNLTSYELAAHLRDYVWVTDVLKGKPGDVANIPYVDDFDFADPGTPGATTLSAVTGLIAVLTTVLEERGRYFDCAYGDIEKIDANLLDELNRTFAHAAVRSEDKALIELVGTQTTNDFAGGVDVGGGTGTLEFYARYIPEAIAILMEAGKEVHPGDLILYMTAGPYGALLKELAASQAIAYARGDIIQKGVIEQYLGVRILVGGEVETGQRTTSTTTGTCELQFLMRAKRCIALAPKRDILIETDRQIAQRKLRIAGSHTFGVQLLDCTECVRIFANHL